MIWPLFDERFMVERLYPDFNPGGQLFQPPVQRNLTLNVRFKPRYNIFLADEAEGEFFVHAETSDYHGVPWPHMEDDDFYYPYDVNVTIAATATGEVLAQRRLHASFDLHNATSERPIYRFKFNVKKFKPRFEPYEVTLNATPIKFLRQKGEEYKPRRHYSYPFNPPRPRKDYPLDRHRQYLFSAKSEIYVLPNKPKGNIVRIDNLSGGLFVRSSPGGKFEPFFPYGFYAPCQGFLCDENGVANIEAYRSHGLNSMVPMMPASATSWNVYKSLDSAGVRYMYDLRQHYKNHSAVTEQVEAIKDSDGLYAYWTFDQPDGQSATHARMWKASSLIKKLDPYHPIAVSLGCDNYYFEEYTKAADIIVVDAHPIGSGASKWLTSCNATYGSCGCDNCTGKAADVATRLYHLTQYERWLNHWPKPKMQNLQTGLSGEISLPVSPSAAEVIAMSVLALNNNAKGVLPWAWPVDNATTALHEKFLRVMNRDVVNELLTRIPARKYRVKKHKELEVSYWVLNKTLMLSVVNLGKKSIRGPVVIDLPRIQPTKITTVLWGTAAWDHRELFKPKGMKLQILAVDPLSTNIILSMLCCDDGPSHSGYYD
ncbi:hypothetical protein MKX08_002042 [Trichoderma sp. CBMAI-0020]|nr:hypothetical protein MKX08_002042 [Trichoderma sp. CBMAI-0020]